MVYSAYQKQRILAYYSQGYRAPTIAKLLRRERLPASRRGICKFLHRYGASGTTHRIPGSDRRSKATEGVRRLVEEQMRKDDETTAVQLHALLLDKGFQPSLRTILRCRVSLGWTFRGSSYCQLIRDDNKIKRFEWARKHVSDNFDDVIWSDECTVQLKTHRRFACRKKGEPPKNKPR